MIDFNVGDRYVENIGGPVYTVVEVTEHLVALHFPTVKAVGNPVNWYTKIELNATVKGGTLVPLVT